MIQLSTDDQHQITAALSTHATDQSYHVLIFGSRASGKAQKYSDVDLALIGKNPVPANTLSALNEALENSNLPYFVDVVDYRTASKPLQQQIDHYGVELINI